MLDEDRNHVAVQIAPRWFAVHQQDRIAASITFINVVDAKVVNLDVVWRERKVDQFNKTLFWCAENLQGPAPADSINTSDTV
jgi:hypothetical protein